MYPELITRPDLKVYLPPIGGISVYIFGNPEFISGKHNIISLLSYLDPYFFFGTDPTKKLTLRVHDECNGSDVFGKY